jgi:hypothetical protein
LMLKAGERVESLTVKLADGAAGIRGRVVTAGGVTLRYDRLRVYLVPSAREDADDAAYFAESAVQENGTFSFGNVAPGRYWVLARPGGEESAGASARPARWDAERRAQLRREAGRVGSAVELQPCRRVGDFSLNYVPDK